jgi:hypothetical protein
MKPISKAARTHHRPESLREVYFTDMPPSRKKQEEDGEKKASVAWARSVGPRLLASNFHLLIGTQMQSVKFAVAKM